MPRKPESAPSLEQETVEETEVLPFQEQETEAVKRLTIEGIRISPESKKTIDGFLAADVEEGYRRFAIDWFDQNKDQIQKEKGVPIENVSDEWKINMVLGSKARGGLEAAGEIKKGEYKSRGSLIEKIGTLRVDLAKEQMSPETPFLLLNYLQLRVERKTRDLDRLRERAKGGDEDAGIEAASMEKQLGDLYSARKELAERAMQENLTEAAEQRVFERLAPKDVYVARSTEKKVKEIQEGKNRHLMYGEWRDFMSMPEKQRREYEREIGYHLEMTREEFDERSKDKGYDPRQASLEYQKENYYMFRETILMLAQKQGIGEAAFYGLLEKGYQPYGARVEKSWLGKEKIIIPMPGTPSQPRRIIDHREMSKEAFDSFVKETGDSYLEEITSQATAELGEAWEKEREKRVRTETEKRLTEISESPKFAEGGIERLYKEARQRIVTEYIKRRTEKELLERKPEQEATDSTGVEEKTIDEKYLKSKIKSSKIAFKLGRDTEENNKAVEDFLGDLGLSMPEITKEMYEAARKKKHWVLKFLEETIKKAKTMPKVEK